MTEKRVYSDKEIKTKIKYCAFAVYKSEQSTAAMLQQLMDERDAARKELRDLEGVTP